MTENIIVAPSILSADFANLERDLKKVEENGADWLHIDVMDGHFVPNITIGAPVVKALKKVAKKPLDVHLMIENPDFYLNDFMEAGSDIITFHYEATKENTKDLLLKIKEQGIKAGLSIKPKTNPEEIKDFLDIADIILIMTVEPGFGGQSFMPDCAKKIEYIKKTARKNMIIEVDGGINGKTAQTCKNYGANALVAGSYIYGSSNIKEAISSIR